MMGKESIWRNVLIAIDNLDPSMRAVEYVGEMVGDRKGFALYLFHVLPPFPPKLLEFGGSEDPQKEEALTQQIREDQDRWVADAIEAAQPIFLQAKETLQWSHVPMEMVCSEVSPTLHRSDVVRDVLNAAENCRRAGYFSVLQGNVQKAYWRRVGSKGTGIRYLGGGVNLCMANS
jgi:hypothetical protein